MKNTLYLPVIEVTINLDQIQRINWKSGDNYTIIFSSHSETSGSFLTLKNEEDKKVLKDFAIQAGWIQSPDKKSNNKLFSPRPKIIP